jgi:hypothetical protein
VEGLTHNTIEEGGIVAVQDSGIGLGSCASILQDYYLRFSCSLVGSLTHNEMGRRYSCRYKTVE